MIVLDMNVLSEALKPVPSERVMNWLSAQDRHATFMTAITQAEVLYGLELLPAGKRKAQLKASVSRLFEHEFRGQILSFDDAAADAYPRIAIASKKAGRPISQFDAMIAAVAHIKDATLATRNISDFEGCGIRVINPWKTGD